MKTQLNKRPADPARRIKVHPVIAKRFSHSLPPNVLLFRARQMMGVSRQLLAEEMGISRALLRKYECSEVKIPASFLLKIFMFGLDFWTDGIYWNVDASEQTQK